MSREFKFRAWDGACNRMQKSNVNGWKVHFNGTTSFMDVWVNVELMQFTGLKDKNGKEIYEGDIVRDEIFSYPLTVIYHKERCSFMALDESRCHGPAQLVSRRLEVIGNIYEDKEKLQ